MAVANEGLRNNASRIGLREILELIPKFDGKNMSLGSFLRTCNDARQLLEGPTEERFFLIYVRSKIVGEADAYLSTKNYNNWTEFSTALKQIYGSKESISQLQTELASVFQKPKETVAEYGKRVDKLLYKMIDIVRNEYSTENAKGIIELIQNNAVVSFIRGLYDDIETRVITQNPQNLKHAIDMALIAEKETHEKARIRKFRNSFENVERCGKCNKFGHNTEQCKFGKMTQPQTLSNQKSFAEKPIIICNYCETPGHSYQTCKKRQSDYQSKTCTYCNRKGHEVQNCRTKAYRERNANVNSLNSVEAHREDATMSEFDQMRLIEAQSEEQN